MRWPIRCASRGIEAGAAADAEPPGEGFGEGGRRFRAHHGSISLPERRATEEALKAGEVPAVVATASLELGIDMGAVDLVCQVESPGSVARGLQRVGRAGHVVRGVSKGRLIAKTPGDLLESAALCRAMLAGRDRAASGSPELPRRAGAASHRVRGDGALGRSGTLRPGAIGLSVPRISRPSRSRVCCG